MPLTVSISPLRHREVGRASQLKDDWVWNQGLFLVRPHKGLEHIPSHSDYERSSRSHSWTSPSMIIRTMHERSAGSIAVQYWPRLCRLPPSSYLRRNDRLSPSLLRPCCHCRPRPLISTIRSSGLFTMIGPAHLRTPAGQAKRQKLAR